MALPVTQVAERVIAGMAARYAEAPPLLPGAAESVRRVGRRWPLGLASSSPSRLIEYTLEAAGLAACFSAMMRRRFRAVVDALLLGIGASAEQRYRSRA